MGWRGAPVGGRRLEQARACGLPEAWQGAVGRTRGAEECDAWLLCEEGRHKRGDAALGAGQAERVQLTKGLSLFRVGSPCCVQHG